MNQNKTFLLSALLATSVLAQSNDIPVRPKTNTETQQQKYCTMTGLENFAGKLPKDITLSYLLKNRHKHDSSHLLRTRLLIVGKHGIGKTLLVKELAKAINIPLLSLNVSDFQIEGNEKSLWSGLHHIFDMAKEMAKNENKQVIILLDNIDFIDNYSNPDNVVVGWGTLRSVLDQVEDNPKINIFATAHPGHGMRREIISRIGCRELLLSLPDAESRRDIFGFYLSKYPAQENLDLSKIVKKSNGFISTDIKYVVKHASELAQVHDDKKISQKDLWEVFQSINEKVQLREAALKSPTNFFEKNGKVILVMVAVTAIVSYSFSEKVVKMLFTKKKKSKKRVNQTKV